MRDNICPLPRCLTSSKGALFGLDARIAMATFAVLSITVGYFSYGKIQKARDASLLRELQGIEYALQQYQADMGTFPAFTIRNSNGRTDFDALIEPDPLKRGFIASWNGPYLTHKKRQHKEYGDYYLRYRTDDFGEHCTHLTECYVWVELRAVPLKVWQGINAYIDEAGGASKEVEGNEHRQGKVRADAQTDPLTIYYRTVKRKR